jgi:hypothetical protein
MQRQAGIDTIKKKLRGAIYELRFNVFADHY